MKKILFYTTLIICSTFHSQDDWTLYPKKEALDSLNIQSTELLKSIDLSVTKIENTGIMLPVISSHCEYFKGAHFEQELIIKSSISIFPKAKLDIDYSILCAKSSIIHVKGYTTHAFVNKNNKPVRVPKMISENFVRKGLI